MNLEKLDRLIQLEERHPGVRRTLQELRLEVATYEELDRMIQTQNSTLEMAQQAQDKLKRLIISQEQTNG